MTPKILPASWQVSSTKVTGYTQINGREMLQANRDVHQAQTERQAAVERTREAQQEEQQARRNLQLAIEEEKLATQEEQAARTEQQKALRQQQEQPRGGLINIFA